MGDSSMRGTNTSQDIRFSDKESKALKGTKFPKEFNERVDMRKVNLTIMRPWVAKTVTDLVGFEDDIVVEYVMGLLEDPDNPLPDPKKMQISLGGFLADKTPEFMLKLWQLLLSAQISLGGIPAEFLAAKKAELLAKQAEEAEIQSRMLQNSGNAPRRDEYPGRNLHPSFPDQRRPGGPPRQSRYDDQRPRRSPPPRDREGRAYPQQRNDDRDYGGYGGSRGNGRPNYGRDEHRGPPPMRDTYKPSSGGRDRRVNDSRSRTPPRRKDAPRGRSPSRTPPVKRGRDVSGSPSPSRSRSRSRSPSGSPPPKRRARSASSPRSPDVRRRRARRDSISRSRSPPSKRRRDASPSPVRSPSPPPRRRARSPSDSRSRSRTLSRTPPRHRRPSRSESRSRSPSRTPPRRAARSPSPVRGEKKKKSKWD